MLHRLDRHTVILLVLSATVLAFAMQQSMVVPALPTLRRELHTSTEWATWLLSAFMVTAAITTPLIGRLGDQYGHARVLQFALGIFFLGSVGAACAWDIWSLIGFRAVQGCGGAVLPLCFSIVKEHFPPRRTVVALATVSGLGGGGGAIGIMYSGAIVDHTSWRLLFATGAVALGVAALLVRRLRLESTPRARARLDLPGAVLLAGSLLCLLLALTEANRWGWGSPSIVGLFAGAAGLIALWVRVERRSAAPMVDVRVLARRPVLVTNLTTFVLGYSLFGVWFLVPQLVQAPRGMPARDVPFLGYGFGASVTMSGLYAISCSLALVTLAPVAGLAARRWGGQLPLVAGMAVLAASACSLAAWHDSGWQVVVGMFGLGVGIALAFAAVPILIIGAVDPAETGVAMGINAVMRTIGGVVGGQVGAALLTARTVGLDRLPGESAFVIAFTACGVAAVVGAVFCLLVYRRPRGNTRVPAEVELVAAD